MGKRQSPRMSKKPPAVSWTQQWLSANRPCKPWRTVTTRLWSEVTSPKPSARSQEWKASCQMPNWSPLTHKWEQSLSWCPSHTSAMLTQTTPSSAACTARERSVTSEWDQARANRKTPWFSIQNPVRVTKWQRSKNKLTISSTNLETITRRVSSGCRSRPTLSTVPSSGPQKTAHRMDWPSNFYSSFSKFTLQDPLAWTSLTLTLRSPLVRRDAMTSKLSEKFSNSSVIRSTSQADSTILWHLI